MKFASFSLWCNDRVQARKFVDAVHKLLNYNLMAEDIQPFASTTGPYEFHCGFDESISPNETLLKVLGLAVIHKMTIELLHPMVPTETQI